MTDCDGEHFGLGYCRRHHRGLKLYGDPLAIRPVGVPVEERLWANVDQSAGPDACWPWTGKSRHVFGYGSIGVGGNRKDGTHRVAYRLTYGEIPKGMVVRHTCDNPPCCNPAHLVLGTQTQNLADMTERGRRDMMTKARGENSGTSKLTESDVREIRRLRPTGVGPTELANRFGVSVPAIKAVLSRRTWNHVV